MQLNLIAWILVIVGAINWGLVGLAGLVGDGANWNLVNMLLGSMPEVESVVYTLVGISGAWMLVNKIKK